HGHSLILEQHAPAGFNIGVNVGVAAGQTVMHLHVHLIPRYPGDVPDPRGGVRHVIPGRGNYLRLKIPTLSKLGRDSETSHLVRGAEDPLLPHLRECLDRAESADFAVAFVLKSGVELLREHLVDLLRRGGRLRIVTGDYLDVTDPDALAELLDLSGNLQLRVFEAGPMSFHPKSYIFHDQGGAGTAFVGSSNLTRPALRGGVEWNCRVFRAQADQGFAEIVDAFESLFVHPRTRPVDLDWIDAYRQRRRPISTKQVVVEVADDAPTPPPEPHVIQREALAALQATRQAGNEAGLVVLATGLGKTWLAAFDSTSEEFPRVLFVAHREEILAQAMRTFRRIRPQARLGLYTGEEKQPNADVLFASIQTLGRIRHLERFTPEAFDYIVVDEFHHAAARTYRRLIDHFTPKFFLGLTATPERMDGGDLLALCQENLVYRKDLVAGIEAGLLCPFQYFGVPDEVDYSNIPWRSSRFDEEELTKAVATNQRAANALEQYRKRAGQRTLAFCCSQRHADFMVEYFVQAGVKAVAVHSGPTSAPRASALEALAEGQIEVIFAVDMFNEGLDLPSVDTVLMLRPTESTILWQQQFGRGLRRSEGKGPLRVIDYIGNHRSFLVKIRALLEPLLNIKESDAAISAALRLLQQGRADLPPGCGVTYELETVDIISGLLRTRTEDDALLAFYDDFRQRHGARPTAVELYHAGYNPRALRRTHGSWPQFLQTHGDLTVGEATAVDVAGEFFKAVEATQMTKSFKMLTLLAMVNRHSIPGSISITDLVTEFRRVARRSDKLRADVGAALENDGELRSLILNNPVAAWCGGLGTRGTKYFTCDGSTFQSVLNVPPECREEFQGLLREIVDWRLAEYLRRGEPDAKGGFLCKVIHADSRPIVKLPNRTKVLGIPQGWTEVTINGRVHFVNFAKEFVNLIHSERDSKANVLGDILRGWFGTDVGLPGTRFDVEFTIDGDQLWMAPVPRSK
ncbi:MAG: DEAD/DEAH box helicase family protein, partial [Planctomycetota bacterium]